MNVSMDPSSITRILDKVGDVRAQEPNNDLPSESVDRSDSYRVPQQEPPQAEDGEEIVQVGEQVIPVTSAGYYYPVASGVPACFTGDTVVETPSGKKRMDELKIGDLVLTAEANSKIMFNRYKDKRMLNMQEEYFPKFELRR
ncbi:hypothetical protein NECAME_12129 [Necator americanus]|uniref:Uncharacterized protein n=1 Tax=Necator americanus TaxID=51031 RepID=W2T4B3_NECAM|nr:hypothetical protein NECAME_12129 [Necator americanus]ETN75787.1 hypothetical protein NECAME_12129 [Necator americanus]